MNCPNKNQPDYLELEKNLGEIKALSAWHLNGEKTPTPEQGLKLLDSKSLNILHHMATPEDNKGVTSSNTSIGLAANGIKDAEELGKTAGNKNIRTIYTSPLERAVETSHILAKYNGANIIPIDGLKSWNIGNFDKTPDKEFPEKYYVNRPDTPIKGGESFNEFKDRFSTAIQSLRSIGEDEAILTHSKGIAILKAQEDNYGDFNNSDYFKHINSSTSIEGLENIRQFNINQEGSRITSIANTITTSNLDSKLTIKQQKYELQSILSGRVPQKGTGETFQDASTDLKGIQGARQTGQDNFRGRTNNNEFTFTEGQGLTQTPHFSGYEPNFGLTQSRISPTGEKEVSKLTGDKISKLENDQNHIHLDDTINPETQQRRHNYYITDDSGKKLYDIKESITEGLHKNVKARGNEELGLLLAEHGTRNHKMFEDIIKSYLNPDGTVGLGPENPSPKEDENHAVYWKIHKYISDLTDFYRDKGVKLMPECKIVRGKEMAGTIDLLAIYPDGSYDKYDWKFIKELSEYKGVDKGRLESFKGQADRQADILKSEYGLSDRRRDFMIPIKVRGKEITNKEGITTDFIVTQINIAPFDPQGLGDQDMYLQPVVIHLKQDDNTQIQVTLDKLHDLYENQIHNYKTMSLSERNTADIRIDRLQKAAFGLAFKKDLSSLSRYVLSELAYVPQAIEKLKEGDKDINPQRILDRLNAIKEFAGHGLQDQFEAQINNPENTEDELRLIKERKSEFDEVLGKIAYQENAIKSYALEYAQQEGELIGIENFRTPEAELDTSQRWVTAMSQIQMKSTQILTQKFFQATEDARRNSAEAAKPFIEDNEAIKKAFTSDPIEVYTKYLLESNKYGFRLAHKYKTEFFQERKDILQEENPEKVQDWFRQNTTFNEYRYTQDFENLQRDLEGATKAYAGFKAQISQEDVNTILKQFVDKYNPGENFENTLALRTGDTPNRYLIGNDKWFSDKYSEIQKNPTLSKLYNDALDINKQLASLNLIEEHEAYSFFPHVSTGMLEGMKQGEKMDGINRFWHEISVSHGEVNAKESRDPLRNEAWKELSMPYLSGVDKVSRQNKDIPKVYTEVVKALEKYKALKNIENDLYTLIIAEGEKKVKPIGKYGKLSDAQIDNRTNIDLLKELVDLQLYGAKKGPEGTTDFANTILGKILKLDTDRELSGKKLLHSVVAYNSLVGLSFRITSILSNIVGGEGNINMQGKVGQFFNSHQINKSHLLWASRDKNLMTALKFFDFRMESHLGKELSKEAGGYKELPGFTEVALGGQRIGDQLVEDHIGGAMLQMYKLNPEGKIVNIRKDILDRTSKEGKTITPPELLKEIDRESKENSLLSTMKIKGDKKTPYWEVNGKEVDLNKVPTDEGGKPIAIMSPYTQMRRDVLQTAYKCIGNMNAEDRSGMHIFDLASAFTQYRNWIPGQIQSRFGKWNYETVTESNTVGRWREFFSNFFGSQGVGGFMKHQLALASFFGGDLANPSLRESSDRRYDKIASDLAKRGTEFKMSREEFFHTQVGIAKSIARETLFTLGTMSLLVLAASLSKQESDPDVKARLAYSHKLLSKFYNEFSFYYDPREFEQLFQNSLPVVSLFKNVTNLLGENLQYLFGEVSGSEQLQKGAHPGKAAINLVPGAQPMIQIISLFDTDISRGLRDYMGMNKSVNYF